MVTRKMRRKWLQEWEKKYGPKTLKLKDLPGWEQSFVIISLLRQRPYGVYCSPDKKQLASVHLDDFDVCFILDRVEKKLTYMGPVDYMGAKITGMPFDVEGLIREWENNENLEKWK